MGEISSLARCCRGACVTTIMVNLHLVCGGVVSTTHGVGRKPLRHPLKERVKKENPAQWGQWVSLAKATLQLNGRIAVLFREHGCFRFMVKRSY